MSPPIPAVERRALVAALALTLPLALYGIPYAYAASSSSYVNTNEVSGLFEGIGLAAHCNTGDYATGGGEVPGPDNTVPTYVERNLPQFFDGSNYNSVSSGQQPNAWAAAIFNFSPSNAFLDVEVFVVCQHPIAVAGLSVPEFGQLYIAIALSAVVYFVLSRQYAN